MTVLNRAGNELPPYNPELAEDNSYGFKAKEDSGKVILKSTFPCS